MPIVIEQTLQALQIIVQSVPVGTNLALIHLMWSILNSFISVTAHLPKGIAAHRRQKQSELDHPMAA